MILQEGLNNYIEISEDCVTEVETFMSTRVFGKNILRVGKCLFPRSIGNKGLVGEFNFKGNQSEMVLDESNEFIDVCTPDPEHNAL